MAENTPTDFTIKGLNDGRRNIFTGEGTGKKEEKGFKSEVRRTEGKETAGEEGIGDMTGTQDKLGENKALNT